MKRHPVLPEPDLTPHHVVAEEKTSWLAPFGRQYVAVTVFLLVVMVLGYGGIVYGYAGYRFLFLAESRHYSAGFIFALAAWAAAASAIYLLNALLGERVEPKYTQLAGAVMFASGWWGVYAAHNTPALVTFFIVAQAAEVPGGGVLVAAAAPLGQAPLEDAHRAGDAAVQCARHDERAATAVHAAGRLGDGHGGDRRDKPG